VWVGDVPADLVSVLGSKGVPKGAVVEVAFSDKKEGYKYYPGKVHMPGPASLRPEELSFPAL
jgi:hypothetical protein